MSTAFPPVSATPAPAGGTYQWWRPYPGDLVLVAALFGACGLLDVLGGRWVPTILPFNLLLLGPLAWRRSAPEVAAGAVATVCLAQVALGDPTLRAADVAVLVVVYSVAAYGRRWAVPAVLAAGAVGAVLGAATLYPFQGLRFTPALAMFLAVAIAWTAGLLRRAVASREATVQVNTDLERSQKAHQAVIAAAQERARIARDLHDVVAHSVAVMIAQADGGRYAARTDPAAATQALETIADTGRQALSDIRRLVGVLRQSDDAAEGTAPQPGLADVPALVKRLQDNGLEVTLEWRGAATPVEAGPALAVYRIVQEGLTNVLKHAGPAARAWVTVTWGAGLLVVEVADDGAGPSAATDDQQGLGHLGMRERAALYGGSVDVGARPGGGYAVRAIIPIGLGAPAPPPPVPAGHPSTAGYDEPAAPTPTEAL